MTPQQIEAMKQALEALEYALNKPMWNRPKMTVAITAIKEALAQTEQKPVANYCKECLTYNGHHEGCSHYTHPPQRKPLTDEEIDAIYTGVRAVHHEIDSYVFARAIEQAHGIKENKHDTPITR